MTVPRTVNSTLATE